MKNEEIKSVDPLVVVAVAVEYKSCPFFSNCPLYEYEIFKNNCNIFTMHKDNKSNIYNLRLDGIFSFQWSYHSFNHVHVFFNIQSRYKIVNLTGFLHKLGLSLI